MAYCIARALSWGLVTLLFESLSFNKLLDNLRRRLPRGDHVVACCEGRQIIGTKSPRWHFEEKGRRKLVPEGS